MAKRRIELLSPARDLTCGIEAIRHGADAVYIGGPAFGARAAAANSVDDIRQLCDYAHLFKAKVYVTLNTILYDDELRAAEQTIQALYDAGVDALIVQDMALLKLNLPPIALHASTQMDNRTADKARSLEDAGFEQIVLARELSLEQIREIHCAVNVPLEAFVHGALCVSYSGRCYASQYCFGRSANRGRCAQFCRLPFDLIEDDADGKGRTVLHDKHLLSLCDMNRSDDLEAMMDAGVSSFKIEGRLKDVGYVKNVTAYYRQRLDAILARRSPDYERSSAGTSAVSFRPVLAKSFNRGFTDYFLHGQRSEKMQNFLTPKSVGESVGTVAHTDRRTSAVTLKLTDGVQLSAGDGLCYVVNSGSGSALQGFRVNKVEGGRVFPSNRLPGAIPVGTPIFRNTDYRFEQLLTKPTATRTLGLDIEFGETPDGYRLTMTDETGRRATHLVTATHEEGKTPQAERITSQLTRLGDTIFSPRHVTLSLSGNRFIPASQLATWRRECVDKLIHSFSPQSETFPPSSEREEEHLRTNGKTTSPILDKGWGGDAVNVSNSAARAFYEAVGAERIETAYELEPSSATPLMTCKYCLRFALGACLRQRGQATKLKEPLTLRLADGRRFALKFDCKNCQMLVYASN